MGFYSPSQIVQDARRGRGGREGVEFLPVDVVHSDWDNALVDPSPRRIALRRDGVLPGTPGRAQLRSCNEQPAIHLVLPQLRGLSEAAATPLIPPRAPHTLRTIPHLCPLCSCS